jgi:glycosyltransferase involved in cell wall biosynthesis
LLGCRSAALRLLFYTDATEVGGAEQVLGYLIGALDPYHEVGVMVCEQRVAEVVSRQRPDAAVITVAPPVNRTVGSALREHLKAVRSFQPHLFHAFQSWPFACTIGLTAAALTPRLRIAITEQLPVQAAVGRRRLLARRLLLRRVDVHLAVGAGAAREVEALLGLPAGAVEPVPNGVPPARPVGRREWGKPVIGSLGRITPQKGYDLLVEALPSLPEATVVIVGDGPSRGELEARARELGVEERLEIVGWVDNPRDYLERFDLFVLPSRWEGMPLSILEAMHAGLAVVATDVGSVRELVEHGTTGLLVAPGDRQGLVEALRLLLCEPRRCAELGERARALARDRYTDRAMARRYEAIYAKLLGGDLRPANGR